MRNKRVSSKDVAREAGVSQATVSYVLNNNANVKIKPETKAIVIEAAKKLNYHTNFIARNMRLKKSSSIGIVTSKTMSSNIFMQVLDGIKASLVQKNYSITLCFAPHDSISDSEYIKYYNSNLIDGLIFMFTSLSENEKKYLDENSVPYVMINAHADEENHFQVKTNIENAIHDAVLTLKTSGKKQIGFIGAAANNMQSKRYEGYVKAMDSENLKIDTRIVYATKPDSSDTDLELEIKEFFSSLEFIPEAMLCDSVAVGFITTKISNKLGIKIPQELSLVTIGTSHYSGMIYPSLSAIEAPLYSMGQRGCMLLFEIMENDSKYIDKHTNEAIILEWSFIKRESC